MAKSQRGKRFVWTEHRELQLIQFYKKHRCLWDLADLDHNNKDVEKENLQELAKQFGNNVSTNTIRTKFRHLQLDYLKSLQAGSRRRSGDRTLTSKYKEALAFLNEHGSTDSRKGLNRGKKIAKPTSAKEATEKITQGRSGTLSKCSPSKSSSSRRNGANSKESKLSKTAVGPEDGTKSARYMGLSTFSRLPRREDVDHCDIAIVGIPFDAGTSYRPGARFGPAAIRAGSRLLRPYHPGLRVSPFESLQVADCGDIAANPFKIDVALTEITNAATALVASGCIPVALGGDHTVALPMLRAVNSVHGPVALLHFDAHLDTWDTYFGAPHTHGTVFLRASEEGLLDPDRISHIGIRGPLYSSNDLKADAALGFRIISTMDVAEIGVKATAERIKQIVGDAALYISVDIDVLDPAHAPGTGTPEAGGLSSRELLGILRLLAGCNIVGADVVEVSPAYDHAEVTAIAAAHVVYELISLIAVRRTQF